MEVLSHAIKSPLKFNDLSLSQLLAVVSQGKMSLLNFYILYGLGTMVHLEKPDKFIFSEGLHQGKHYFISNPVETGVNEKLLETLREM